MLCNSQWLFIATSPTTRNERMRTYSAIEDSSVTCVAHCSLLDGAYFGIHNSVAYGKGKPNGPAHAYAFAGSKPGGPY